MANYRPKSLDELNNLYDKSLEAENQIKKSSSRLEDKPAQTEAAFLPDEDALPMKKTAQQIASDEIADQIGSFAKSFGSTDDGKKPLAIATVQSKPRPKKKLEAEEPEKKKSAPKESKPKLIRDPERTSLFENYKKVMDDEDDYNFGEPEKSKKVRLGRKHKSAETRESVAEPEESRNEIESRAEETVESVFEDVVVEKKKPEEKKSQFKQVSYEDYLATRVEKKEEEVTEEAEVKKTNPVLQVVLMVTLLCVLLSSIGIGCIKAFSGANSDRLVMGKSFVYTATRNYADLGIKKGSLVITEDRYPAAGEIIAYKKDTGKYAFAAFQSALNEESVIALDSAQQILVFNGDLRGVVKTAVPVLGTVFAVVISYFLPIMGLMLLLAALLVLLVYFVSRGVDLTEEDEEEAEQDDTEEEEPYDEAYDDASYDDEAYDDYGEYDEADYDGEQYTEDYAQDEAYTDEEEELGADLESLFNI